MHLQFFIRRNVPVYFVCEVIVLVCIVFLLSVSNIYTHIVMLNEAVLYTAASKLHYFM